MLGHGAIGEPERVAMSEQQPTLVALTRTTVVLFDLFARVLEARDIAARSEIAESVNEIMTEISDAVVERTRTASTPTWEDSESEVLRQQHALFAALLARLIPPAPIGLAAKLRVIK